MASDQVLASSVAPVVLRAGTAHACRPGRCRCGCCSSRLLSCVLTLTARLRGSAGASQRRTALCRGEHLARSVRGIPGAPPAA